MGVRLGGFSGVIVWSAVLFVACGGRTESFGTLGFDSIEDAGDAGGGNDTPVYGGNGGEGPRPGRQRCGNGRIDGDEMCDGNNLDGETCQSVTMTTQARGTLRCSSSCTFDTTGCSISTGGYGGGGAGGYGGVPGYGGMAGYGGYYYPR